MKYFFNKRREFLYILISVLRKKFESSKLNDNLVIFAQKIAPKKNVDINFQSKGGQHYF